MKKIYEKPELAVVEFGTEDIMLLSLLDIDLMGESEKEEAAGNIKKGGKINAVGSWKE